MITQTILAAGQGWREAEIGQKGRAAIIQQERDRLEALSSHNKERGVEWRGKMSQAAASREGKRG